MLFLVVAWSEHVLWAESIVELGLGHDLLLKNDVVNAASGLLCLLCNLGAGLVTDVRVEGGNDADGVLHEVYAVVCVCGDAVNALNSESVHYIAHPGDGLGDALYDYRLHNVELELAGLGCECNSGVVSDNLEANLVGNFRDDRVNLARHD